MSLFGKRNSEDEENLYDNSENELDSDYNYDESDEEYANPNDNDIIEYTEEYDTDVKPKKRKFWQYPREYFDPCDVVINKKGAEEYYFNIVKSFNLWHIGWFWSLFPSLKEKAEDWVWDKDFLHDYAVKQHIKAEKLNSMKASEQLGHDIGVLFTRLMVIGIIIVGILAFNIFVYKPNTNFNSALSYMQSGHYAEASEIFDSLDKFNGSDIYGYYCHAQVVLKDKDYDKAHDMFEKLAKYQSSLNPEYVPTSMEDMQKECIFQKALSYYNKEEWAQAIEVILPVIKYKNSVEYYEKCMYQLAEESYENNDYYTALERFSNIVSFEDTEERMNALLSNIYNKGLELYNQKEYFDSADVFNSISIYNYKDSAQMSTQCFYELSQEKFKEGDYIEAMELFKQIPHYKDSQTMVKECIYRTLDKKDYSKNIVRMLDLVPYRDVADILQETPYNLYAEWIIVTYNGKAANNETFIFDTNGRFICDESRLPALAISNDDSSNQYSWNGEYFETRDGRYQIYIENYETSADFGAYITLKCINGDSEVIYRCQKINELDEYYSDNLVPNTSKTSDHDLIQMYIDELKKNQEKEDETVEIVNNDPISEETNEEGNGPDSESSENNNPESEKQITDDEEEQTSVQISNAKRHRFEATVIKVYNWALLVEADSAYEEATVSKQFFVNYENATDLAPGDICQITYSSPIDINVTPCEITADSVSYIGTIDSIENDTSNNEDLDEDDNTGGGIFS